MNKMHLLVRGVTRLKMCEIVSAMVILTKWTHNNLYKNWNLKGLSTKIVVAVGHI